MIPNRWNVTQLNPQLRRWKHIYNTVGPHQALQYLTPLEFLDRWKSQPKRSSVTNHADEYTQLTLSEYLAYRQSA